MLCIDSFIKVYRNIHYKPRKMERKWKALLILSIFLTLTLLITTAVFAINNIAYISALSVQSALIVDIYVTYVSMLYRMKRSPVRLRAVRTINRKPQTETVLLRKRNKPTCSGRKRAVINIPMLIILTHLLFTGAPNCIYLTLKMLGQVLPHRYRNIIFMLSSGGLIIDAVCCIFLKPLNRRKIVRKHSQIRDSVSELVRKHSLVIRDSASEGVPSRKCSRMESFVVYKIDEEMVVAKPPKKQSNV